jgi:serine/threonine protein kinase
VALKLFGADKVTSSNVYDVFRDAVTLIGLQEDNPSTEISRHLIQVYDIGVLNTPSPRAFMSMKLVAGKRTLENSVRRFRYAGGMPVSLSLKYLRQILVPLAWMHSLDPPAVHGDLKPDNILMAEDSTLILTDFGLAARLPLGSMGGAVQYQAPESLFQQPAGTPADIYAVGLTWYEMLTGHHPFSEVGLEATAVGDDQAFIRAHQVARKWEIRSVLPGEKQDGERIPPAFEFNEEMRQHPQLGAILNRCLAYKQSERYHNARSLLSHIDQYIKDGNVPDVETVIGQSRTDEEKEIELVPKTPEAIVNDAQTLILQGQAAQAAKLAENLLRQNDTYVPAILIQAKALANLKQIEKAKEFCEKAQKLASQEPGVLEAMADILEAEGKMSFAQNLRLRAANMREEATKKSGRRL